MQLENATCDGWAEYLNEAFKLGNDPQQAIEIELVEVNSLGEPRGEKRAPFSLLFASSKEMLLEQGIYSLHHPKMGTLAMFLVPQAPDDERFYYEAVFT